MTENRFNTTARFTTEEVQDIPHMLTATLAELTKDPQSKTYAISPPLWDCSEAGIRRHATADTQDFELYMAKAHGQEAVDPIAVWIPRGDRARFSRWSNAFWGTRPTRFVNSDSADKGSYRAVAFWLVSHEDHERHLTCPEQGT